MKYLITSAIACAFLFTSCKEEPKEEQTVQVKQEQVSRMADDPQVVDENGVFFKLSLAQWSLHREIESGALNPMDFARKASEMGFDGVEYVSALYRPEVKKYKNQQEAIQNILVPLKLRSEQYGVKNLIIMVDDEGDLASSDMKTMEDAINKHSYWVDAAAYLGCHSIRVNLFADEDTSIRDWMQNSITALRRLGTYAAQKNVNVIVENHGGYSSNAEALAKVMANVKLQNVGVLPDFGNFCLEREGGERWGTPCVKEYDKYKGIAELMPYAKGVSAKSYAFDENGNETTIDYEKMLGIVKDAGYGGYIGVEYEGDALSEEEGILATKKLLLKAAKTIK